MYLRRKMSTYMYRTLVQRCPENTILDILFVEPKIQEEYDEFWKPIIHNVNVTNKVEWDEYLPLWRALKLQARYNSPIFTSHGLGHSMRTASIMDQLLCESYYLFETNQKITRNMVLWTGLLHDLGYSEYDLCQQGNCEEMKQRLAPFLCGDCKLDATGLFEEAYHDKKFLHAQLGANMLKHIFLTSPRLFYSNVKTQILEAVQKHNSDSLAKTQYDPDKDGTLMSIHDMCLERKYNRVNMATNPLLAMLRIADNLDISNVRLTPDQHSVILILYQKWYHKHPRATSREKKNKWAHICELYQCDPSLSLRVLFQKSKPTDFVFTYSSWIIYSCKLVHYSWDHVQPYFEIDIELYKSPIKELSHIYNWNAALYQLKRIYEAFKSIYIFGHRLSDIIHVRFLMGLYPLSELLKIESHPDYIKYAIHNH